METDELIIREGCSEIVTFTLSPIDHPENYRRKVKCLQLAGMTEEEAEQYIAENPIQLELFYDIGRDIFAVETRASDQTDIYNPYTGILNPQRR